MMDETRFAILDRDDPLAPLRDEFQLPSGVIYLNGNSLGPMPKAAAQAVKIAAEREWGEWLITSWNKAGWFDLPYKLGARVAQLIRAESDEVTVSDATGLNLFKAVAMALSLNPGRRVLVMEGSNFPTDNYMVQGLIEFLGRGHQIRFAEKDHILDSIDDSVAAVVLTQVHYRTSHILDMAAITAKAHEKRAIAVWDLCHSAGVLDVDLNGCGADLAVGCTYKYLNGGPGSPAFTFVARRHQDKARQPLTGWWGHEAPFRFERDYRAKPGIGHTLTGTQAILSMRAAEAGLGLACRADLKQVRHKAAVMGDLFIEAVEALCAGHGFKLVSPRAADQRGGHVAFDHEHGYPIMKALIARGVIGDFRAPSTLRFGFSPLFLRYADVGKAAEILADIMARDVWKEPAYQSVDKVT